MTSNVRYVNLETLPRKQWGQKMIIDWDKSVNIPISFVYDDITGEVFILENIDRDTIRIYIDGYTNNDGYIIYKSTFVNGSIGGALRKIVSLWRPDLIKYFVDKNDANIYTLGSDKLVELQCPICGYIKKLSINELSHTGFHCNRCDDGFSYPSKLMFAILDQINIDFIPEISKKRLGFKWLGSYKFDFYFRKNNKEYFIEMDGEFHYHDRFGKLHDIKKRDSIKDSMACAHNIEVIRIDCNYGVYDRFEYIKNNIFNSSLYDILNLKSHYIDWELCHQFCTNSLLKSACDYWKIGVKSSQDIANILKISRSTVHNYLRDGAKFGLCDYTPILASSIRNSKGGQANRKKHSKQVAVYDNNELVCVAFSIKELCRKSISIFGKQFKFSTVSRVCNKHSLYAYGYTMNFITREEYEQLAPQFNQTIQN